MYRNEEIMRAYVSACEHAYQDNCGQADSIMPRVGS